MAEKNTSIKDSFIYLGWLAALTVIIAITVATLL